MLAVTCSGHLQATAAIPYSSKNGGLSPAPAVRTGIRVSHADGRHEADSIGETKGLCKDCSGWVLQLAQNQRRKQPRTPIRFFATT